MHRKVLILCTGNSARSQMAEGLVNHFLGDRWQAFSAGVAPSAVNPRAVQVMAEIGIDISCYRSKSVSEFLSRTDLDLVVTVCDNARETCPVFPAPVPRLHIAFEDPAQYSHQPDEIALPAFRRIRDQIRQSLLPLLESRAVGNQPNLESFNR
jgi:arsenate reductase